MGSSSSKFKKALQRGDEIVACQLYVQNPDIRNKLDPNSSYGENSSHSTAMHFAARHAMKSLLRDFLLRGGNPNKTDASGKTSLHHLMGCTLGSTLSIDQRRLDCFYLLLKWRKKCSDGMVEELKLFVLDNEQNTPLHFAAASGLVNCAKLLISHGAPLFHENVDRKTACCIAEDSQHSILAAYLEAKMVFQDHVLDIEESYPDPSIEDINDEYRSMCELDLQEAKDQLIVETADMLKVPLFTAEALLSRHEWSRVSLLETWMNDQETACHNAGVKSETDDVTITRDIIVDDSVASSSRQMESSCCAICDDTIHANDKPVYIPCRHEFCRECLQRYLSTKINDGRTQNIECPAFNCNSLIPVEISDKLISREMATKYLKFDLKAFVDTNPNLKWCPHQGCGLAVRLNDAGNSQSFAAAKIRSVHCSDGHFFCWDCDGEAHDPCPCDVWQKWCDEVTKRAPQKGVTRMQETEEVANKLWMTTNSKQCPNCRSRIQKNEGCNHMFCLKCKHDFCWVCLEPWRLHNTETGGYFRCNRFEAVEKVQKNIDEERLQAEQESNQVTSLNRFLHYYSRYENHSDSFELERKLLCTIEEKMSCLKATSKQMLALDNVDTSFIRSGMRELLKSRLILRGSYPYGYYLTDDRGQKAVFEFMQDEVEKSTEALSHMIARAYLKSPRSHVIEATKLSTRKRQEYVGAIARGLIPPEEVPFDVDYSGRGASARRSPLTDQTSDVSRALAHSLHLDESTSSGVSSLGLLEWLLGFSEDIGIQLSPETKQRMERQARTAWDEPSDELTSNLPLSRHRSRPGHRRASERTHAHTMALTSASSASSVDDQQVSVSATPTASTSATYVAQFDYTPAEDDELPLAAGDVVEVLGEVDPGWLRGRLNSRTGVFPAAFVVQLDGINSTHETCKTFQDKTVYICATLFLISFSFC